MEVTKSDKIMLRMQRKEPLTGMLREAFKRPTDQSADRVQMAFNLLSHLNNIQALDKRLKGVELERAWNLVVQNNDVIMGLVLIEACYNNKFFDEHYADCQEVLDMYIEPLRQELEEEKTVSDKVDRFSAYVFAELNLRCDFDEENLNSSLLGNVLYEKVGNPYIMAIIYAELASKAGLNTKIIDLSEMEPILDETVKFTFTYLVEEHWFVTVDATPDGFHLAVSKIPEEKTMWNHPALAHVK